MTGRCYFFHRFAVSGVRRLAFVGCPEWEYGEGAGWVEGGGDVSMVFTEWESFAVKRVVGAEGERKMREGGAEEFTFT